MKLTHAVVLLLMLAGCTEQRTPATWEQPSPEAAGPPISVLPSGLVAFIPGDDAGQLRIHDARTGAVLRELTVPAGRQTVYSPDFKYAAQVDRGAGLLTVYTLDGDTYRASGTLNATALGGEGLALVNADFVPRTGRLAVELDGGDGARHQTVGIDPADPGRPLGTLPGFSSQVADSSGEPAEAVHVEIPSLPTARDVSVHRSTRELVDATVIAPDDDGDGSSAILYSCGGPQIGAFTIVCHGQGDRAELVALTADPARSVATIRTLGELKGKPFNAVLVSPDRRQLIAQRADGFYATTVAGGKPRRLFGPLDGFVTRWN